MSYIRDKTQYFKEIAFGLIMVSKGDYQVKKLEKIKDAKTERQFMVEALGP